MANHSIILAWKIPWEEEMATRFSVLAWKIPWTEEPGKLQFIGVAQSDMTEST